ncbi:MAG: undecaprenyl-phosphate glucose phosphotransferase [Anaerolineae bacterium]|nr:undecaprenyl-phosphate glucose phosphotransferase [Anaerolineae bacterium]
MIERIKANADTLFTSILVLADACWIGVALFVAYYLRLLIPWPMPPENVGTLGDYFGMMVIQIVSVLAVAFFYNLYHEERARPWVDEMAAVAGAVSIGTLIGIALTSLILKNTLLDFDYSRGMIIYAWALSILLVGSWHMLQRRMRAYLRGHGWAEERVLVVGSGEVGQMIVQKLLASPETGYRVVGVVNGKPGGRIQGVPILGTVEQLPELIQEHNVAEVIVGEPEQSHQELLRIISLCDRGGRVNIKIFPDFFQIMATEMSIGDLNGLPLLTIHDTRMHGWRKAAKRGLDLFGAAVGLTFLSPVFVLTALVIKLDSPGPVFFAQERMGLDGKPFWMIKFRSMRQDAEKDGPGWTTEGDPRKTQIGSFLRSSNLDELPQLINVLLGEMSLVGPRPERPVYVEQFRRSIPRYMDRHREKGGMTGWAQVNGLRGDTSISERIKYDLWYVENWSLWLDVKILLRQLFSFGGRRNAY